MIRVGEYIFARPYPDMDTKAEPSKLRMAKVVYIDRNRYRFYNVKFEYEDGRSFVESKWFTNKELIEGYKAGEYQLSELRLREIGLLPALIIPWEAGIERKKKRRNDILDDVDIYNEIGDAYDPYRDLPDPEDMLREEELLEIREMIRRAEEADARRSGEEWDAGMDELYALPDDFMLEDILAGVDMDAIMREMEAEAVSLDFDDAEQWDPSMDVPDDFMDIEGLESEADRIEKIVGKGQNGMKAMHLDIYEPVDELDMRMAPSFEIPDAGVESEGYSDDELYDDEEAWDDSMEAEESDSIFLDDMSNEDMLAMLQMKAPEKKPVQDELLQSFPEAAPATELDNYDDPEKEDDEAEFVRDMTEAELCKFFNVRPEDLPKVMQSMQTGLPAEESVPDIGAAVQQETEGPEDEFIREMTDEEVRQLLFGEKPGKKQKPKPEGETDDQ